MPVYNGANYLREAVDSALGQTYKNIEVIVVNDGSDDGGRVKQIAESYKSSIRYYEKPNGGVSSALNKGISEMSGTYFSWLSHDDVYLPWKLETQIKQLQKLRNRNTILYSNYNLIDSKSVEIGSIKISRFKPEQLIFELMKSSFLNGCSLLIPLRCFQTEGLFREDLVTTQDYDLWFKMMQVYPFIHIPEALIQSRVHQEQISLTSLHFDELDLFYSEQAARLNLGHYAGLYHDSPKDYLLSLHQLYKRRNLTISAETTLKLSRHFHETTGAPFHKRIIDLMKKLTSIQIT